MSPQYLLLIVAGYFALLLIISWITSKGADNQTFFTANKHSPWYLVAFGMIGTSLSGVTFISVPGDVGASQFSYMQVVFGYLLGYLVIGTILMPMYYRLNLTSIYSYLEQRYGFWAYKTGAAFFLISRVIGASFRLYLVAIILQKFVLNAWGIPFSVTVLITIVLIWLYTYRGGIKTVVWTDTLQTLFMLLSVVLSISLIKDDLGLSLVGVLDTIKASEYSQVFFWDWREGNFFPKSFLFGTFIAICMTGLDQDLMQKNLTCKNIKDAQKNMFWFSIILVLVNALFLALGALLYIYANAKGIAIPEQTDDLFPMLALSYFTPIAAVVFILGLIAAAYSSSDSALTALTTSFCVDFLNFNKNKERIKTRYMVHIGFSIVLLIVIIIFNEINDEAVITKLFKVAGYTYGPLLGLYAFGLLTKKVIKDKFVPVICIASPVICYFLQENSEAWFNGYKMGFELLIINGLLTFTGLMMLGLKNMRNDKNS